MFNKFFRHAAAAVVVVYSRLLSFIRSRIYILLYNEIYPLAHGAKTVSTCLESVVVGEVDWTRVTKYATDGGQGQVFVTIIYQVINIPGSTIISPQILCTVLIMLQ